MIKLVASDLDGTIIDKAGSIYENNFKAINDLNQKNIDFVICTGKTYPIVKGMCSKFNASYGIFGNGNEIINLKTGEEIYKQLLTSEQISSCISIAKEIGVTYIDKSNMPNVAIILIRSEMMAPAHIRRDCLEKKPEFLIL